MWMLHYIIDHARKVKTRKIRVGLKVRVASSEGKKVK